jgi:succinate dehydrogenase/fumarate reductase flavoprotein subunit
MAYDIIIVGGGSAGMTCAITAAKRGLKILVIEKDNKIGGTLHLTAGHLSAANTNLQKRKGINDSIENHYNDIVKISNNTMQETLTKKAVSLAPITLNWLEDLGYPFHDIAPLIIYGHEPYSVARTYLGKNDYAAKDITGSGKSVFHTLLPLWDKYISTRNITVLYNHSLKSLVKKNDEIIQVEVENILVKKISFIDVFKAKIVITTGGYAANAAFYNTAMLPFKNNVHQHYPNRLLSSANQYSQGEGITAITNIGGIFTGAQHHLSTLGGVELEPNSGRTSFWDAWARVSNSKDRTPREIYINENGVRFMNEHDLTVDQRERIVLQQPNQRFYVVFDEKALHDGANIVVQWNAEKFKEEATKEKCCWQGNTVEELAKKINVPIDKFSTTIIEFNQFVTNQRDEGFSRSVLSHKVTEAPFYALLVYAYSLISFGGISVNENLEVVTADGNIINNLYAAGEILGAAATSGNSFCGGMLLTPALSFGKWLGETLQQK